MRVRYVLSRALVSLYYLTIAGERKALTIISGKDMYANRYLSMFANLRTLL